MKSSVYSLPDEFDLSRIKVGSRLLLSNTYIFNKARSLGNVTFFQFIIYLAYVHIFKAFFWLEFETPSVSKHMIYLALRLWKRWVDILSASTWLGKNDPTKPCNQLVSSFTFFPYKRAFLGVFIITRRHNDAMWLSLVNKIDEWVKLKELYTVASAARLISISVKIALWSEWINYRGYLATSSAADGMENLSITTVQ